VECGICWKGKHCDFIDSSPDIDVRLRSAYVFTLGSQRAEILELPKAVLPSVQPSHKWFWEGQGLSRATYSQ